MVAILRRHCSARRCAFLSGLLCILLIVVYNKVTHYQQQTELCTEIPYPKIPPSQSNNGTKTKKILFWTSLFSERQWFQSLGQESFKECPEQRCEYITDRCQQPNSDAVLFYMPNLLRTGVSDFLPRYHPPWQIWVLGMHESEVSITPGMFKSYSWLNGLFNWTFSHRFDADIFLPYYYLCKILDNPKRLKVLKPENSADPVFPTKQQQIMSNYSEKKAANSNLFTSPAKPNSTTNYAKSKKKFALWFVSNCKGIEPYERIKILKELVKNGIPVDVFGSGLYCKGWFGAKADPCLKSRSCSLKLMSTYKFYLSFENSQCNHYITEKFFRPLRFGTVPVAFGAPLGQYEALAPRDSFLHVENFTSIKALAEYMKHLDQNDQHYNRYFKWKESHVIPNRHELYTDYKCKLCSDLWDPKKKPKVYNKLSDWWNRDKNCVIHKHNLWLHQLLKIKSQSLR